MHSIATLGTSMVSQTRGPDLVLWSHGPDDANRDQASPRQWAVETRNASIVMLRLSADTGRLGRYGSALHAR